MSQLQVIPISLIRENPVAIRSLNRDSEEFQGLVDSIRNKGFFGAITVRPQIDPESKQEYYEIVDGLHRFSAAKDAGLEEINVDIVSLGDDQVLEAQLMANVHKVETRPIEYSRQIRRILARNPLMTESELASKLAKSTTWISQRLNLSKIENKKIAELINEGKIVLSNAYGLAKLPNDEMSDWVDRAMTLPPDEFIPQVNERVKEIKDANRKGTDAKPSEFQPVAFMQKAKDVKDEMESQVVAANLIEKANASTAQEGFNLAIAWVLHLDLDSVKEQKDKYDERKAKTDAAKQRRTEEKQKKKDAEAADAAAHASDVENDLLDIN